MKGKLIVLEGTDGSGKATQTRFLVENLKKSGYQVEVEDFPQYGQKSAGPVEDYLNGKYGTAEELGPYVPSIFYAVDRFAAKARMLKNLQQGMVVVSNRYVGSSMAHQGGKIKDRAEQKKYFEWLDHLEFEKFGIPRPDLNLLLHVPAEVAQKLVDQKEKRDYTEGRDMHEDDLDHLESAERVYLSIAKEYGYEVVECVSVGKLQTPEEISELVWQKVKPILE